MACQTADPNQIESQLLLPSVIGLIFVVVIGIVAAAVIVAIANIAIAIVYSAPLSNCFSYYCSLLSAPACCDFRRLAMRQLDRPIDYISECSYSLERDYQNVAKVLEYSK